MFCFIYVHHTLSANETFNITKLWLLAPCVFSFLPHCLTCPSTKGPFTEFMIGTCYNDWRQKTAVLNISSGLWQLELYTQQEGLILTTELSPPVMQWEDIYPLLVHVVETMCLSRAILLQWCLASAKVVCVASLTHWQRDIFLNYMTHSRLTVGRKLLGWTVHQACGH